MKQGWIEKYLDYTGDFESPTAFHEAAAFSALAAVAERKVWTQYGGSELYPNLYMILVGPPASAKSTAMDMSMTLVRRVPGIILAPDKITREAMWDDMEQRAIKILRHKTGKYIHTSYTVAANEWSLFLGEKGKNDDFLTALVSLFDCRKAFEYVTKTSGTNILPNVFYNMFGCIQPQMVPEVIPYKAIGSGFTSRIIYVVERGKRFSSPRPKLCKQKARTLVDDLIHINTTFGEYTFSDAAESFFVDWYGTFNNKSSLAYDNRFASYIHRKPVHATKLSMLYNLSRTKGSRKIIEKEDFERAVEWLDKIETKMPGAYGSFGLSQDAVITNLVLELVRGAGYITTDEILAKHWRDVDMRGLMSAISTLTGGGLIRSKNIGTGRFELELVKEE